MKKVAVGLSGGVDSAVSALLLKQQGYDVVGVHLYCWPPKSVIEKDKISREEWIKKNGCRADEDRKLALKTALEIGVPFKILDFSEEYNSRVVDYFYREYEAGRTPNPDVLCNSEIKFGLFLEWALENGFDYVATGHYASLQDKTTFVSHPSLATDNSTSLDGKSAVQSSLLATDNLSSPADDNYLDSRFADSASRRGLAQQTCEALHNKDSNIDLGFIENGHPETDKTLSIKQLCIPKDKHKDQTYFLWKLTQKELAHTLFPLGELLKSDVREIAEKSNLTVAKRPDSQGICFIGDVNVQEFLRRRLVETPGEVKDVEGKVIGTHKGIWFYTIGERGGWELTAEAQRKYVKEGETPIFYVISKDAKKNELVVGVGEETRRDNFQVTELNWLENNFQGSIFNFQVRIRHGGKLIGARVEREREKLLVKLEEAQRGVAAGQSAVFYDEGGRVVAGGVIE